MSRETASFRDEARERLREIAGQKSELRLRELGDRLAALVQRIEERLEMRKTPEPTPEPTPAPTPEPTRAPDPTPQPARDRGGIDFA